MDSFPFSREINAGLWGLIILGAGYCAGNFLHDRYIAHIHRDELKNERVEKFGLENIYEREITLTDTKSRALHI